MKFLSPIEDPNIPKDFATIKRRLKWIFWIVLGAILTTYATIRTTQYVGEWDTYKANLLHYEHNAPYIDSLKESVGILWSVCKQEHIVDSSVSVDTFVTNSPWRLKQAIKWRNKRE